MRFYNLKRQILLDDEMHTVGTALYLPVREILGTWKTEDPCLPLSALYRALLELGLPFSEMTFRMAPAVAGLLAIVALPWLAMPSIGRRAAILLAWLLALSPVLAIYSGMVRPYAFVALLAPAAALLVLRWREEGDLGWGLAYAAIAALGLWFHLGTAPMLAAPLGLVVIEKIFTRREVPSWRVIGVVAAVTLLLIAALLVPALASLRQLYAAKGGIAPFSFELVPPIARLQAGSRSGWGAVPFWLAAAAGVAALWRGRRAVAAILGAVALAQWVGLAILQPIGLLNPIIFNRYLIGTLPLVLVFVASGLAAAMLRLAEKRRWVGISFAAVFLAGLVLLGPYAGNEFRRTSFRHSKDFIRFDLPRGSMDEALVPAFYRGVARRARGAAIAEYPFRGGWSATRTHYVYQTLHGGPVLAIEPFGWPCDRRLRLRNHVCHQPAAILGSEARFLVVHRDVLAEEQLVVGGDDSGNRFNPEEWEEMVPLARRFARGLRRRWGPPAHQDEQVVVWDLDRVRSRLAERPRRGARAEAR